MLIQCEITDFDTIFIVSASFLSSAMLIQCEITDFEHNIYCQGRFFK